MTKEVKIMAGIAGILIIGGVLLVINQKPNQGGSDSRTYDQKLLAGTESYHINPTKSAKVTVVEFGDFQCPACAAAEPAIQKILAEQKNNPDFDFVYRHLPLPQHANALISAEAAEASGEQGKFWEMYSLLYAKQAEWSEQADALPLFASYAEGLGLNVEQFKTAVSGRKNASKILQDARDAQTVGISSTPTFFINGKMFVGIPGTAFTDYLQSELKK